MTVRTQLTFKEYLNLMYLLTYRKAMVIFVTFSAIIILVTGILNLLGIIHVAKDYSWSTQLTFAFVILIAIPFSIYRSTKRNYDSNKKIQEQISYSFSGTEVSITGESFNSTLNLNSSYKIVELKKWFLIYQSNRTVNIIPKINLSASEMAEMRSIFRNLNKVKVKLKQS